MPGGLPTGQPRDGGAQGQHSNRTQHGVTQDPLAIQQEAGRVAAHAAEGRQHVVRDDGIRVGDAALAQEGIHVGRRPLVHGEPKKGKSKDNRHVTGQQLVEGFRQHVLETYGPVSYRLIANWGLKRSIDVGHVVFNLIEAKLFGSSPEDSLTDFEDVIDFKVAFQKPFESAEPRR